MPRIKVPIVAPPYPTLDGIELSDNAVSINDGYIDEAGFLVKRPGLDKTITLPESAPVDGIGYWEGEDLLIAVCNQRCYKVDAAGNITEISTGADFQLRNRPTFAFTKIGGADYMAVSNGGTIYISIDGATLAPITDTTAPTLSTHLVFSNNRLVSNNVGSDQFRWSDFEDPFTWDTLSVASAEGEPDQITALYKAWNEIVLFGSNTIEFWYNTFESSSPFARMSGTQLNQGTLSPDGIVFDGEDSVWYFIDSERNINILQNRSIKNISRPIERLIQQLDDVTDARLDIVKLDSHKFVICTFPTDNITFVYDQLTGYWFQWGKFNETSSEYEAFLGRSISWANLRGLNYAGSSTNNGEIYLIDRDTYQDNEEIIRTSVVTGWIDNGTHFVKRWRTMLFRLKRQPTTGFTYQVLFRKDLVGSNDIERTQTLDLGESAYVPFVQRLHNFGMARSIQFEIYCTDNIPFLIGNFELDFTQNRN